MIKKWSYVRQDDSNKFLGTLFLLFISAINECSTGYKRSKATAIHLRTKQYFFRISCYVLFTTRAKMFSHLSRIQREKHLVGKN